MEKRKKGSLLAQWKHKHKGESPQIKKMPEGVVMPLSFGEQRLWFLQQLYPNNPFYNYSESILIHGKINKEHLRDALKLVYGEQSILRSNYHLLDGKPIRKLRSKTSFHITELNFSEKPQKTLDAYLTEASSKPFNLAEEQLIRISLIQLGDDQHMLFLSLNHSIGDKWSMGIFWRQVTRHYSMLSKEGQSILSPPAIEYHDYAYWQQNLVNKNIHVNYWVDKLSGKIPKLDLPKDFHPPAKPTFKGGVRTKELSKELSEEILEMCAAFKVTPYVFLLTASYILLYRYTKQNDILIGSPISNRDQTVLEDVIGFFNETVVLRTWVESGISFKQLLEKVKTTTIEAFSNKDVPFDSLVKQLKPERSLNLNPFFQVMFLYNKETSAPDFGDEFKVTREILDAKVSKFDLTLSFSESGRKLSSHFEYATDLFHDNTIARMQAHLILLLSEITTNPEQTIDTISMLTGQEKNTFSKTPEVTESDTFEALHTIIAITSLLNANKTALVFGTTTMTYSELHEKSDRIAKHILKKKKEPNEIVALCVERSLEMIVGLLGILKAGCAYLPIDPNYPSERINIILDEAKVDLIIINDIEDSSFQKENFTLLKISEADGDLGTVQFPIVKPSDIAYVIYTSGSTGKPKGVTITHQNIVNSTKGREDFYGESPESFLLLSSIAFDSSKAGIFWTLCTGGTLVISEERLEQDVDRITDVIASNAISHTLMLPSLYKVILQHVKVELLSSLTTVIVAGEECTTQVVKEHFNTLPNTQLYNEYGPTEATVWCIAHKVELEDTNSTIPIGKPVAGAKIYLLDDQMNEVPQGAVGQIYIGGIGLSGNYLNRPELTEQAYIDNPLKNSQGKIYKTGDLAKVDSKGRIKFLGRVDHQVKIRGYRIELDEIKNGVLDEAMIEEAEVCVTKVNTADQLFLYVVLGGEIDIAELKANLAKKLPKYMMPSRYCVVDQFPKLPNGKVDKKALMAMNADREDNIRTTTTKSLNPLQKKLIAIWEEVLGIENLNIHDNFFEVGGDSIISIQIIAKARKVGIDFSPNELFEYQTIAELDVLLQRRKDNLKEEKESFSGSLTLLPIQRWFFETHKKVPHFWNQAFILNDFKNVDKKNFREATDYVIKRHDALRSVFKKKDDIWTAEILSNSEIEVFFDFDLSEYRVEEVDGEIQTILQEHQSNLNLEKDSLFRCLYFDLGAEANSKTILLAHHLVVDLVSWKLILEDFKNYLGSEDTASFSRTTSIFEWGNYLKELANENKLVEELDFWNDQLADSTVVPTDFEPLLPVTQKSIKTIEYRLDTITTKALSTNANDAYGTKMDELLLTAVFSTLSLWSGSTCISFAAERHGRETIGTGMDLSNTIGWFTSYFPVKLESADVEDHGATIISVKEKIRNIPNGGIGYGVLRYLTNTLEQASYPQIIFNFLGDKVDDGFEFVQNGMRHSNSEVNSFMEINSYVDNGELVMKWSYSTKHYREKTIEEIVLKFSVRLKEIITHCTTTEEGKFTPSDFPELGLDQDDFDGLMDALNL